MLKPGTSKHIAVSVNKESVSKSFFEKLLALHTLQYPTFYKTFYWLLSKILETEFLKKNNTTGTDLSVLHFDQNFRRNFLMNYYYCYYCYYYYYYYHYNNSLFNVDVKKKVQIDDKKN